MPVTAQKGSMAAVTVSAGAIRPANVSLMPIPISLSCTEDRYNSIAQAAAKLSWNPIPMTANGSATSIMSTARLIPEGPSLEAKEQALITNALVTESLHPVNIPMAKAQAVKAATASLFLTFNTFSACGMMRRNPAK